MVMLKSSKTGLELNITIAEAKELALEDYHSPVKKLNYNPRCFCTILPRSVGKTTKIKSTISPKWNETVKLKLRRPKVPKRPFKETKIPSCSYLMLSMSVWDYQKTRTSYLGEVRISLEDILQELVNKKETEFRWFRMYSSTTYKRFVTGSIKCKFSLSAKKVRNLTENVSSLNLEEEECMEDEDEELSELDEGYVVNEFDGEGELRKSSESVADNEEHKAIIMNPQDPTLAISIKSYLRLLQEVHEFWKSQGYDPQSLLKIDEQNFYSTDVTKLATANQLDSQLDLVSDALFNNSEIESDVELPDSDISHTLSSKNDASQSVGVSGSKLNLYSSSRLPFSNNINNDSRFLLAGPRKDKRSDSTTSFSSVASGLAYSSADEFASDSFGRPEYSGTDSLGKVEKKKRSRLNILKKKKMAELDYSSSTVNDLESSNYVFRKRNELKGLLFMEIISASGLPPFQNATRTGFDMDPFVVVSFGKNIVRTSWRHHSLNPVFNERLYFEIMETEKNFNVVFDILDKDRISFNDAVCTATIPIRQFFLKSHIHPDSSSSNFKTIEPLSSEDSLRGGLFRKNKAKNLSNSFNSSDFLTSLEIDMELNEDSMNSKVGKRHQEEIYQPKIKVRFRYEEYSNLRKRFWYELLSKWKGSDIETMDFFELQSFLSSIGSTVSDEELTALLEGHDKNPWTGDTLTFDECISFFDTIDGDNTEAHIIDVEKCPLCGKSKINSLNDDIVTHLAICGSKDWSSVTKILKTSHTTSSSAKRGWYSKALIKIAYGKLRLGNNNANILVQDRNTGLLMEEKMSVFVRLGIRLLYHSFENKASGKKRVKKILKNSSLKQGLKFDNPNSANLIASFVKFYSLDMSDYLIEDIAKYETFNEFFYRKLKPTSRRIEALNDDNIAISGADCRCSVFETTKSATELWIKGRGFTIAKLLGNKFSQNFVDQYSNGSIVIFRLAPQDYHRFHTSVSGTVGKIHYIEGEYYTVNPMAIRSDLDVYGENVRVLVPIITKEFGTVVMCCIGAMMVGSTVITVKEGDELRKGDEVGYFKFGGSTVVVLFPQDTIKFDADLVNNSKKQIETLVSLGMSIGHTPGIKEHEREFFDFNKASKEVQLRIMRSLTGSDVNGNERDQAVISNNVEIENIDSRLAEIPSWEAQHLDLDDAVELEIEGESNPYLDEDGSNVDSVY